MLLNLALWIQATDFFTYLRGSAYVYPCILSLHMVGIAFFGGMILMSDMRILGLTMRNRPIADLVDQLRAPKRWGFVLAAACGLLMLGCKAEEYYYNAFFRAKVSLLILVAVHALIFHRNVYTKAAEFDRAGHVPGVAKTAAALSLLLWTGIACMGRGIGYIEPPFGIHAQLFGSVFGIFHL
ncbi:MAG: hypothetical protein M3N93_15120 [Acidobacteriota bacterium]|nr:hypothetical protein [Acidobacteriota bacterium]